MRFLFSQFFYDAEFPILQSGISNLRGKISDFSIQKFCFMPKNQRTYKFLHRQLIDFVTKILLCPTKITPSLAMPQNDIVQS